MSNAKNALNGGTVRAASGKTSDQDAEGARSTSSRAKGSGGTRASKKTAQEKSDAQAANTPVSTEPLPADQAQTILKLDLDSIARERAPKDPVFVAYIGVGQVIAQPTVHLTKDDDQFALKNASAISGGEVSLKTSWQLVRF